MPRPPSANWWRAGSPAALRPCRWMACVWPARRCTTTPHAPGASSVCHAALSPPPYERRRPGLSAMAIADRLVGLEAHDEQDATEEALQQAIRWLLDQQDEEGGWWCGELEAN